MLASSLLLLVASASTESSALAIFVPPPLADAGFAPQDGRVNVPTNARLFTDHPAAFRFVVGDGASVDAFGPRLDGVALDGLQPGAVNTVTLFDDFNAAQLTANFTVSDVADVTAPSPPTARGARFETPDVVIGLLRATDDQGVAFYTATDDVTGAVVASFDDVDGSGDFIMRFPVFVDAVERRGFRVSAVDFAGNVSATDFVDVELQPASPPDQPAQPLPFGCASSSSSVPWFALVAMLALLARRRFRATLRR